MRHEVAALQQRPEGRPRGVCRLLAACADDELVGSTARDDAHVLSLRVLLLTPLLALPPPSLRRSLIACTAIVYVQDTVSWTLGFAIPAAAMGAAVLLFLAGSRQYRHVAPTESPMARVVKVVYAALQNRWA